MGEILDGGDRIGSTRIGRIGRRAQRGPAGLERQGVRVAWVPRRAGERGALEAGALSTLLPGGRPVSDPAARVDLQTAWASTDIPASEGRDTAGIVAAAAAGDLGGLVVGGVDPGDLVDPQAATAALDRVGFVVSLELPRARLTTPSGPTSYCPWRRPRRRVGPTSTGRAGSARSRPC